MQLLDEIGQVSHIFSDKTGTLTSNHMVFRRCVIGGQVGSLPPLFVSVCVAVSCYCYFRSHLLGMLCCHQAYGCGETAISRAVHGVGAHQELNATPPPSWAVMRPSVAPYVSFEQVIAA